MKEYFQVAIDQQIERAKELLIKVDDSDVPQEFLLLSTRCRDEIIRAKEDLEELQANIELQHPDLQSVRLRRFRRAVDSISRQETTGVAALSRRHEGDIFLTRLAQAIRAEIKYPFPPPTVVGLSSSYFYIHNDINLMFVPLSEGNFLLHLPDMYHELGHPLLYDQHSPRTEALQKAADTILMEAASYLNNELDIEERRQGPHELRLYLVLWQRSWWKWINEFLCDLFAVYTLGPAFVWSHIHLCMKNEHDPFYVPTRGTSSHPADDARMRLMLMGLERLGFGREVPQLERRWAQYLEIAEAKSSGAYKRCFPEVLLRQIEILAYQGIVATKCRIVDCNTSDPIHSAFNEAWYQFWHNPYGYIEWEKHKIIQLREACGIAPESSR